MARKKLSKPGTKVAHKLHGHGVIVGPTEDPEGVLVRFDQPNPKWGTDTWEVSTFLLAKRWGRAARENRESGSIPAPSPDHPPHE